MTEVHKRKILQILRNRGLHARADWVDRQLPERVDLDKNARPRTVPELQSGAIAFTFHDSKKTQVGLNKDRAIAESW